MRQKKTAERISLESAYKHEKKLILQNIRRASKGSYTIPKTDVEYAKAHLPSVNKLTDAQLKMALKMAQKIRVSPIYTAKGQKKIAEQKRKTLQKHGVSIDSKAELDMFGEFMDDLKEFSLNRIYDSTKAAELWGEMREQGATPKEIKQAYKKWVKSKQHGSRRKRR